MESTLAANRENVLSVVSAILAEVLPAADPIPGRTLRECGLDSIAATRVVLELRRRLGVDVPVQWLAGADSTALVDRALEGRAPEGRAPADRVLADRALADRADGGAATAPATAPAGDAADPFPLSPLQQAYVVGRDPELTDDPVGCRVHREFTVPDADCDRLVAAWHRLVAHHDALRLVVSETGTQRVLPDLAAPPVPVHDRRDATPDAFAAHVRAVRDRLERGVPGFGEPLAAVEISLDADDTAVVHLALDGLAVDGRGLAVLLADWHRLYTDPAHVPPTAPLSLRDCALLLAAERDPAAREADLAHWTARLDPLPPAPVRLRPAAGSSGRRAQFGGELDPGRWAALRARADRLGVSPTALLLTAFTESLARPGPPEPCAVVLTTSDRTRLPATADRVVGAFTSTAVFAAPATTARPFDDAAREVHDLLWRDLDHIGTSGVTALRALRGRGPAPDLPVVFTSLLDAAHEGEDGGFADAVVHGSSRTSGVALDCQVWSWRGGLAWRWDVAADRFATGDPEVLSARFATALDVLATPDAAPVRRPLNELQQAYWVARVAERTDDDGCQVHHGFEFDHLDVDALAREWTRLVDRHDALRSCASHEGDLVVLPQGPGRAHVAVVDLPADEDADAFAERTAADMVGAAFPLGRWPQCELRVVRRPDGSATLHAAVDLIVLDGRSIHLVLRELVARTAGADARYLPEPADHVPPTPSPAEVAAASAHWRDRLADLPAGPPVTPAAGRRRTRLSSRLTGWAALRAEIDARGLHPDAVLVAALLTALEPGVDRDFAVPVVRWTAGTEALRPGEHTVLSWLARGPAGRTVAERAADNHALLAADLAASAVGGLGELRRKVLRQRDTTGSGFPVVWTGLLEMGDAALPPGTRTAPWRTATPDVSLDCIPMAEGDVLSCWWDAVPDDFAPGAVEAAFERFTALLAALAEGTGWDARAEGVTGPAAPDLDAWNDTAAPFPVDRPAHVLVEDQARRTPDAVAVRHRTGTTTYRELDRRANGIAHALRAKGVRRGTAVAVSLSRGPDLVAAVLGVLKAGGCYVPVDPALPAARAASMLRSSGVEVVLGTTGPRWEAPAGTGLLDVADTAPADHPPTPVTDQHDLAYVIFTSGSTGTPKGVAVDHRALLNLLNWCGRTFAFGPADTGLMVTSLGFDLSVFDLFGLLGCGASVYVADEKQLRDPVVLLDLLRTEPITFWNSAPTTLAQVMPLLADLRGGDPGTDSLRLVFLSGDYTPLSLPDELRRVFRGAEVVSLGGATEATVWSNFHRVDRVDPEWRSIPYGRPIDNARYYVLDERLRPCPVDVEGDLYIAGECLAVGYLGMPSLTASRFVADPFSPEPGGRLYRTGDRALYRPDGVMVFLGRADGQVKVRGFRVELGEVEHALRGHPGVQDVVVLARTDPGGDRRLVAYVVPTGGPVTTAELRAHAARTLPDYMLPNAVVPLAVFPATANGKLDRDALPWPVPATPAVPAAAAPAAAAPAAPAAAALGTAALAAPAAVPAAAALAAPAAAVPAAAVPAAAAPATAVPAAAAVPAAPAVPAASAVPSASAAPAGPAVAAASASTIAEELRGILSSLLGVAEIDPDTDLWDQGATSFTMMQVSGALQRSHGCRIPVAVLLDDPTVTAIAAHVAELTGGLPEPGGAVADRPADPPAHPAHPAHPEHPAQSGPPAVVDFFSAEERAAFKAAGWGTRRFGADARRVALPGPVPTAAEVRRRASTREFDDRPVDVAELGALLALLREAEVDGRARRLYPSAGDTYGVQVYVRLRSGAVTGAEPGLYYHHPHEHALVLVTAEPAIDRSVHFVYNRPVHDRAAFELYLVGSTRSVAPLYGEDARHYLSLEAGYLGQLLMLGQADAGLGLCPIGDLAFDRVRGEFGLAEDDVLLHAFLGGPAGRATAAAGRLPAPRAVPAEVAVIGVAGRYPGADDVDGLWRLLRSGATAVAPPPAARRDVLGTVPGGYLPGVEPVDAALFPSVDGDAVDPQLRLLLHTAWQCLEHAGHTPASLPSRVGVFTAAMWHDHQQVGADRWRAGDRAVLSALAADLPNRVSHAFGFTGPSVAVDTACSSALTAVHLAATALRAGECDAALVAGVNLIGHGYHAALLSDLGLVAEEGSTGAFDAAGPGWSPGEGAGVLLLRRAADAADDTVHALVEGSALGHAGGGRFGAPDAEALRASASAALEAAGVGPEDLGYVECAAAGATIADAAEVEALSALLADRRDPVPVGTVKPNTGHLEAAAGLAQLTKVLLQLRHGELAPTLLADEPSPLVDWTGLPVRPCTAVEPWTGGPRRALVTAIGATGSHAHVVLRAPDPVPPRPEPAGPAVVLLSADDAPALRSSAAALRDHLADARPRPADVAWTTQCGRAARPVRAAFDAGDLAALIADLDAVAAGGAVAVRDERARRWAAGEDVDWRPLWTVPARHVPLPTRRFGPGEAVGARSGLPAASAPDLSDVERELCAAFADVTGLPPERVGPRTPLADLGLTSAAAVRMTVFVRERFGPASATLFFEHRDLAGVAARLTGTGARVTARQPEPAPVPSPEPFPEPSPEAFPDAGAIAVIGLAGRYPGADDLDAFWADLVAGRDRVTPLPADRARPDWPAGSVHGGFLSDVDHFDPLLFGIAPREAALIDPQERLFLEVARLTLDDAGYSARRLRDRHRGRVGVFVGAMHNEYPFLGVERSADGDPAYTGSTPGGIANRVSYAFDLSGPSMTVDTMCSASLTALHLAVHSLRRGECEVAVAGGVNLSLHPNKFVQQRAMRMTADSGRCRAFSAEGDGFVPGEGVGAVLLKPLAHAVRDGDRVHGVIRATAVNHGGHTSGYTVPNPVAQGEVVASALREAGIAPDTVGYVEAHGTGTSLGDPIEIAGLGRALGDGLAPGSVPVGSVKSNIGHLEAAAGIAGLTKVLLQLRHRTLVPSLHAERLNPEVDWAASPLAVQREAAPWPAPRSGPRRAGISAFGAGGSNAHVVVEEFVAAPRSPRPARPAVVVLSARTATGLAEQARRLADHLLATPAADPAALRAELERIARGELPPGLASARDAGAYLLGLTAADDLADIAFTLQVGREHGVERLAFAASSRAEAGERLTRFLAGDPTAVHRGRVARADERATTPELDPRALPADELAARWAAGEDADFALLDDGGHRPVALPGTVFDRVPCRLPERSERAERPERAEPVAARPAAPFPADVRPAAPFSADVRPAAPFSAEVRPADARSADGLSTGVPVTGVPVTGAPAAGAPSVEVPLYERTWVAAVAVAPTAPVVGTVLCLHTPATADLARRVAAGIGGATLVDVTGPDVTGPDATGLDATGVAPAAAGVLDLCDLDPAPVPRHARVALLQALLRSRTGALRVLHVTSGLADLPGPVPTAAGAEVAGFARVLTAEHPAVLATTLDTDAPERDVPAEWVVTDAPGEVCARNGTRHLPALTPVTDTGDPVVPDPDRVHLVVGGTGGLGIAVARHLVRRGARRVVLLGRRPVADRERWNAPGLPARDARIAAAVTGMEAAGATVRLWSGELADAASVVAAVRAELGPIGGVVHCAGDAGGPPAPLGRQDPADLDRAFAAKVDGLTDLLDACAPDRPAYTVLFSSVSAALPALGAGVAGYAAANAVLDAVARVRGLTSVQWPVWRDSGSGASGEAACAAVGLRALGDDEALRCLDRAVATARPVLLPAPAAPGGFDPVSALRHRPATTPRAAVPGGDHDWLTRVVAETLGADASAIDPATPFADLGLESVLLAELVVRLEARLGRPVDPSLVLEHPTVDRLAAVLGTPLPPAPGPAPAAGAPARVVDDRIAVIGMACAFPGAPDVDSFWRNLVDGVDAITEVPADRWDVDGLHRTDHAPGSSISRWGGFVDGIDRFDAAYFGLDDASADALDPAIRLLLENAVTALRDGGYHDDEVRGRDVGVFVGARMSNYRRRTGAGGPSGDQNFIAAHLAHHLDLHGPNLVVDSACSSALVAVQLAVRSLLAGESELALAGAVDVLLDEEPYVEFTAARALSPSGRCRTFDERADGFVPGEGCGVLLLKPLAAALRDGDRVRAVIDAVAVNNDGRTMGLTTPNPTAQAAVVRRALDLAGVSARDVGLVEAHGTATRIGDPIELRALTDAFRADTDRTGFCAVGSVKSGIGHLLSAAGIAGLVKAALAVERAVVPATLHCERPNPRFDFASSPFRPATATAPWEGGRRVAGVSAFGLGGTNAHAIVSNPPPHTPRRAPLPPPGFRRSRHWIDRTPPPPPVSPQPVSPQPVSPQPVSPPPSPPRLVTSLATLRFTSEHSTGEQGERTP
ncbi:amino acid adenylation domain-containing protein [Saccharothrix sp. Mg75]|uniref:amino acid adenylation domain-containing protein n=1 Tax=Saccharothrix sp. Mg75 TaxID=3445357 RepID=UPI003EEC815F